MDNRFEFVTTKDFTETVQPIKDLTLKKICYGLCMFGVVYLMLCSVIILFG